MRRSARVRLFSDAVLDDENEKRSATALLEDPRKPSGDPGRRIPHITLQQNGIAVSTHDLTKTGFVLLAGADGGNWTDAANTFAVAPGIPLQSHRIAADGDLKNPDGRFEATVGIGAQGALLLRPDGVIGWRSARARTQDPHARLNEVMRQLTLRH